MGVYFSFVVEVFHGCDVHTDCLESRELAEACRAPQWLTVAESGHWFGLKSPIRRIFNDTGFSLATTGPFHRNPFDRSPPQLPPYSANAIKEDRSFFGNENEDDGQPRDYDMYDFRSCNGDDFATLEATDALMGVDTTPRKWGMPPVPHDPDEWNPGTQNEYERFRNIVLPFVANLTERHGSERVRVVWWWH